MGCIGSDHLGELDLLKELINQILTYYSCETTSIIAFSFVSNLFLFISIVTFPYQRIIKKTLHIRVRIIEAMDVISNNNISCCK